MMDTAIIVTKIRRSNIPKEYRSFIAKAVQEYVKVLEQAKAIKPVKKQKVEDPFKKVDKLVKKTKKVFKKK